MADITMCEGTNCPLKENCYRFNAESNDLYQSYFTEVPFDKKTNDCEYYWKINKTNKV